MILLGCLCVRYLRTMFVCDCLSACFVVVVDCGVGVVMCSAYFPLFRNMVCLRCLCGCGCCVRG